MKSWAFRSDKLVKLHKVKCELHSSISALSAQFFIYRVMHWLFLLLSVYLLINSVILNLSFPFHFSFLSVSPVGCRVLIFYLSVGEKNLKFFSVGKGGSSFVIFGLRVGLCELQMCLHLCVGYFVLN